MHVAFAPLLTVALLLAGCSPRTAPAPTPAQREPVELRSASNRAAADNPLPPAGSVPPRADAPDSPASAAAGAHVALSGEGLDVVDATTGTIRHLAFGLPAGQVIDAVTRLHSGPPQRGTNTECGAGAMDFATWPDGLSLLAQDASFVGWSLNPPREGRATGRHLTTVAGVGLGSTRRALESAYAATIEQSTLGTEFSAGGLYGVLASTRPDAAITALWAGTSCVFR